VRGCVIAVLALVAAAVATPVSLDACGDKYLSLGRGTRYERSPVARQTSAILIYASPSSELSKLLTKLSVDAALQKAGYKATTVTAADLTQTLLVKPWDVILVDGSDLNAVAPQLTRKDAPKIVPVLFKPTKSNVKQTMQQYGAVLAEPTKSRTFIDALDDAMWDREAERKAAAKKPRN
jgi:hypothetical protein